MTAQPTNDDRVNVDLHYARYCLSDDSQSSEPIVFLHGSTSCHLEFTRVAPYLSEYELYFVDLPGHSGSKHIPFSLDNAVTAVARLISTKIAKGKAHVVGMSLGGFISLELARRHSELILSLFCTGCAPFSGYRKWFASRPAILGRIDALQDALVTDAMFWWYLGVKPFPELRKASKENRAILSRTATYNAITAVSSETLAQIRDVRIAIIAGGKQDSVSETVAAGKVLSQGNPSCKAFVVEDAIHLWDLQLPELFAAGIRAWIEQTDMPKDYRAL